MSLIDSTLKEFQQITRRYALFHAAFLVAFVVELLVVLVFTPFMAKTWTIAATVSLIFLTAFTYFVLRLYFQTKKPEQFVALRDKFLASCPTGTVRPIYDWIQQLQGQESQCYSLPTLLQTLSPLVEKFSVWCHWEDVHWMKETLHLHALQKMFEWVRENPTDLELHRAIATSYMALYQIYQMPKTSFSFIQKQYDSPEMRDKFERSARLAMEELKIVLTYAPNDPWALNYMARVYSDLGLRQEEKKIYEMLLSAQPQDGEIHYRLGKLCFELGHMAQGLHLYRELQGRKDPKAQELISHYKLHTANI